jgi:hypothetical protein
VLKNLDCLFVGMVGQSGKTYGYDVAATVAFNPIIEAWTASKSKRDFNPVMSRYKEPTSLYEDERKLLDSLADEFRVDVSGLVSIHTVQSSHAVR